MLGCRLRLRSFSLRKCWIYYFLPMFVRVLLMGLLYVCSHGSPVKDKHDGDDDDDDDDEDHDDKKLRVVRMLLGM
jgi:hypothetical protein